MSRGGRLLPAAGVCDVWHREHAPLPGLDPAAVAAALRAGASDLLRTVLEHYLGPGQHRVVRRCEHCGHDSHGRPRLTEPAALDFSVTHSATQCAVAVVAVGRVGVDAESSRGPVRDLPMLLRDVLTPRERDQLELVPEAARDAEFLRLWTRKEATVKVSGHGIVVDLASLDVLDDWLAGLPVDGVWGRHALHLRDLPLPGAVAALCSDVPLTEVRPRQVGDKFGGGPSTWSTKTPPPMPAV